LLKGKSDNGVIKITMTMEVEIGGFFKLAKPLVARIFKG